MLLAFLNVLEEDLTTLNVAIVALEEPAVEMELNSQLAALLIKTFVDVSPVALSALEESPTEPTMNRPLELATLKELEFVLMIPIPMFGFFVPPELLAASLETLLHLAVPPIKLVIE
eukprot:TRINITY_DN27367_c0_g1_i1.p2 TRINITY_DN27367_c0_g1~~TRINITY_DN27367_c0_g1_i1.p2  ORF type:complete len:117 (-),score=5.13 TRINITY_DN27367_c0_g1_i1:322-672(-)